MIVYGHDKELCEWASLQLFGVSDTFGENAKAIGYSIDNQLICVVVYNNYLECVDGSPHQIEMSIASTDKRWANRKTLKAFFAYPFIQLNLKRVQITSKVNAEGVNLMLQRLGCTREGLHRLGYPDGTDCYSWSMLPEECIWIKGAI